MLLGFRSGSQRLPPLDGVCVQLSKRPTSSGVGSESGGGWTSVAQVARA